jgi:hypothetical protein
MKLIAWRKGLAVGAIGLASVLAGCSHGCSSNTADPAQPGPVGPTDGGPAEASGGDARGPEASADAFVPLVPEGVPPGWELYSEFSPRCQFYVPGNNGEMPAPLEWESCPGTYPAGLECQKVKQTWKHTPEWSIGNFSFTFFDTDPKSGKPLLGFERYKLWNRLDLSDTIVAEADGQVRFSILQASQYRSGCGMHLDDANEGRVSVHLYGDNPGDNYPFISAGDFKGTPEAIVADSIDSRHPKLAFQGEFDNTSPYGHISYVSSDWFIKRPGNNRLIVNDWAQTQEQTIYAPGANPPGYQPLTVVPKGKDVFIALWAGGNAYTLSWTPQAGLQPLLYWGSDDTRGGGNFGTDGKALVWTAGEGKPTGTPQPYAKFTIMTAPYTTDPAQLQQTARPLREELKSDSNIGHYSQAWYVGCGYAARTTLRRAITVVRLSDGAMWFIPRPLDPEIGWTKALGVSCDHVYVLGDSGFFPEGSIITRFRLNSLGTPLSPDVTDVDDSGKPIP